MLVSGILFPLAAFSARADDILQYIPDHALGYIVARELEHTSDLVEKLAEPLGYSIPSPLGLIKLSLGLGAGIDSSGTLAIALLPGSEIQPMVLLPISDYAAFARSIQADPNGEVCRITVAGEDVLVARIDKYAIIVNIGSQTELQRQLDKQSDPELDRRSDPTARRDPSSDWISNQDVYLAVLPAGLQYLGKQKAKTPRQFITPVDEFQRPSMLSSLRSTLFSSELRSWLAANTNLVMLGVRVDEQMNVRISSEVDLKRSSPLNRMAPIIARREQEITSLGNARFFLAASTSMPQGWGAMLADFLLQTEKNSAAATGLDRLSDELWTKKATVNRLLFEGIKSCSVVMLPGTDGDPLMANLLVIAEVPSAAEYLNAMPQVVETWNEVTEASTSDIKPKSDLLERELRGQRLSEIVVDYATFTDDRVPVTKWMLDAAFGSEGKLRMKFLEVDQTHFLFGLATDEQMSNALEAVGDDRSSLAAGATSEVTAKLLDPQAIGKALLQPKACLEWVARVENEFLGLLMINPQEAVYPEIPDSPPLGLSVDYTNERWQFEVACPSAAWTTLGKYIADYDELE